jgi:hypothetical protein
MAIIWVGTGRFSAYIGPVQDYIDRVVAADVAAGNTLGLEVGVRDAYDVFIRDSINVGDLGTSGGVLSQANSIIKAAPIMAGARTLAGALVPLVGPAPTRFGTEGGWNYNRKTGLAANGTDNYLNSNRANNADPQNNSHIAARVSSQNTGTIASSGDNLSTGRNSIDDTGISGRFDCRSFAAVSASRINANTLAAVSRSSSASFTYRLNGSTIGQVVTSSPPDSVNTFIYARSSGGVIQNFSGARLAFYSIGESLNLALLDARITTLINTFGAAIP